MKASRWTVASHKSPCPICGRPDWCQLSDDGAVAMCMRESSAAFKSEPTSSGAMAHYHRIGESPDRPAPRPVTAIATGDLADIEIRHKVYTELLAGLELSSKHKDDLQRRGLRVAFRSTGYATLPLTGRAKIVAKLRERYADDVLLSVPGIVVKEGEGGRRYLTLAGSPGLLITVRDEHGRIQGIKVRADDAAAGGKYRWLSSKKHGGPSPSTPAHCPMGITGQVETVRITEGPLKADVATHLNCTPTIGADSAANWKQAVAMVQRLGAKTVRLAWDADAASNKAVARGLQRCAGELQDCGIAVEVETWPAEHKGIDDLLAAGGTPEVLTGEDAIGWLANLNAGHGDGGSGGIGGNGDQRPEIEISTDEHIVNDLAIEALAADPNLYQRSHALVQVVHDDGASDDWIDRPEDAPCISELTMPNVRERLSRHAKFKTWKGIGDDAELVPAHPPDWCVRAVHSRGRWRGIRRLRGITSTPVLRRDGTVCQSPGYDPETRLLYVPEGESPTICENPTRADALEALGMILGLVVDFPFATEAHRSAWLAFLLTAVGRPAFAGPAPLFLADANCPGTGKTMLMELVAMIVTGRDFARMTNPEDNAEARKAITSIVMQGDPLILIDNVAGALGTPAMDAALTGTTWKDRLLGTNRAVELPLRCVWAASGNNVALKGDIARRVCHIALRTQVENPEERTGFRHSDLVGHVRQERGRYLSAALTILRAWFVAGKPTQQLKSWGSFDGWGSIIRQAIAWLGIPDCGETRTELRQASDLGVAAIRQLLAAWPGIDPDNAGMTASELLRRTWEARDHRHGQVMTDAICELCNAKATDLPSAHRLGNRLRAIRGRVVGGVALEGKLNRTSSTVWRLVGEVNPPDGGSAGTADTCWDSPKPYAGELSHTHSDSYACVNQPGDGRLESQQVPAVPAVLAPDPGERSPQPGVQITHKRPGCRSTRWWRHSFAPGLFCSDCWPCTDIAMLVEEGNG